MDKISVLIDEETISRRIEELGKTISEEYEGREIHMICVLKGGIFFMCRLAQQITVPVTMDFMAVGSYGSGMKSKGSIDIIKDLDEPIEGKDVLVVEDIVDSGVTLSHLIKMLRDRKPRSLKLCTLLDKPDGRVCEVEVNHTGFIIPDKFVVGYGLDYAQKYRNLPYIGIIENN